MCILNVAMQRDYGRSASSVVQIVKSDSRQRYVSIQRFSNGYLS
jgi:hypothetical protein